MAKKKNLNNSPVKSQPDQKGRLVHLHKEGDKYRVTKPRTSFDSGLVSKKKAEEHYNYQRINPHHK